MPYTQDQNATFGWELPPASAQGRPSIQFRTAEGVPQSHDTKKSRMPINVEVISRKIGAVLDKDEIIPDDAREVRIMGGEGTQ